MFIPPYSIFKALGLVALGFSLLPLVLAHDPSSSESDNDKESSDSYEDGEDCGMDAVPSCFQPVREILDCRNTANNAPCSMDMSKLELLCTYIQDGLNNCTINIIGTSCTKLDPKHSYFLKWLPSLNSVIFNFCSKKNLQVVADAFESKCLEEPIFQCLLEAENQVNWLEVITSQMHPDICINIDIKAQDCLARHSIFPMRCKEFVQIVMNGSESFLEKSGCYNQPSIFVPFSDKTERKTLDYKEPEEDYDQGKNDRECELDPNVLSACFKPLLEEWKCYLNSERACNFSLKTLCTISNESLNSCALNLLGYGCEGTENHQYFQDWLGAFNSMQNELCGSSSSEDVEKMKLQYFSGLSSCWAEFFTCFQYLGNSWDLVNLITLKMTPKTCRILSEKIQFCMWKGFLDFSKNHCDVLLDKLGKINDKFMTSPGCTNKGKTQSLASSSTSNYLNLYRLIIVFGSILRIIV